MRYSIYTLPKITDFFLALQDRENERGELHKADLARDSNSVKLDLSQVKREVSFSKHMVDGISFL